MAASVRGELSLCNVLDKKTFIFQPKYKGGYKKIILDTSKLMHFLSVCYMFVIIGLLSYSKYIGLFCKLLLNKDIVLMPKKYAKS